ncbi:MAG: hypothetical protein KZQ80_15410 [Candidatus Thiodiazotropha sp. (ex Monitilora ramsayi)]|nr:hypothetical protein [Candidatus Thiodiazotropha sp. (ex Monitilora ramsayi)]
MTIFPRWFQYGFIALFFGGVALAVILHSALKFDITELQEISKENVVELSIYSPNRKQYPLPAVIWSEIKESMKFSSPISFTGFKGEAWRDYCTLIVESKSSSLPYGFLLKSRPSMKGTVALELIRGTQSSRWHYGSYTGNHILEFLQGAYPDACG